MGRRELRAELEATWSVWDARRPIRREDMAEPSPPVPAQPAAKPAPLPLDEGTCAKPDDDNP